MDRQLREAEASIASLTGTVKTLEDQVRVRPAHNTVSTLNAFRLLMAI